ncbi:MAG: hypothetical protein ABSG98_08555 [Anaerolineales bacterium]|jgi:hypothetical protein
MSAAGLNRLVGKAVVSEQFCAGVLGECRGELLKAYDLSSEEKGSVMAIRAEALPEFAAAVDRLIVAGQSRGAVPQWAPNANSFVWGVREPNGVPQSR